MKNGHRKSQERVQSHKVTNKTFLLRHTRPWSFVILQCFLLIGIHEFNKLQPERMKPHDWAISFLTANLQNF